MLNQDESLRTIPNQKRNYRWLLLPLLVLCAVAVAWQLNILPHRYYTNGNFDIEPYQSNVDADSDGVDDQTDILHSARKYVATKPEYKSVYYDGGYPDDGYGVCTDVVAFALLNSGYNLMELVNRDILANPAAYPIDRPDKNIDFRRVKNLQVYFSRHAISLTTDVHAIDEWQGGDIVVFPKHIGIVSDHRNANGVPFVIHHYGPEQVRYEQDMLEPHDDVIGHFRIS